MGLSQTDMLTNNTPARSGCTMNELTALGHCSIRRFWDCKVGRVTWPRGNQDPSRVHAVNLLHSLFIVLEDHMLTAQIPKILRPARHSQGVKASQDSSAMQGHPQACTVDPPLVVLHCLEISIVTQHLMCSVGHKHAITGTSWCFRNSSRWLTCERLYVKLS